MNETILDQMEEMIKYFESPDWVGKLKEERGIRMKNVTDQYHTFDDLYNHRQAMSKVIFETYSKYAWKSLRHFEGDMFEGSFITGVTIPGVGDYSYHYPIKDWDNFNVKELDFAPKYDGHTPEDFDRLFELQKLGVG